MDEAPRGTMAALVVRVAPHPDGQKIFLADVSFGDEKTYQVVYGGWRRLNPGDLVAAAPPGARLPNGIKMRRRRFRGEPSYGMLCSAEEMGWPPTGRDEVAVLRKDMASPGKCIDHIDFPADWLEP
jgi:phenylalanyl-tRNA synthetase beta chain